LVAISSLLTPSLCGGPRSPPRRPWKPWLIR